MTHPQPPAGRRTPSSQPGAADQPFPATQPQSTVESTVSQTPSPPNPWSAEGNAPQPPFSGHRVPRRPAVGTRRWWRIIRHSGAGYPIIAPPAAPTEGSKKSVVIVAVTAAVLTLFSLRRRHRGGRLRRERAADKVTEAPPTPVSDPGHRRSRGQSRSSTANGDTRDMARRATPWSSTVTAGTVEITVTKFSTATKPCSPYGLKPGEGMYVIADVTVAVTKGTAVGEPALLRVGRRRRRTKTTAIGGAFSGCGKPMPPVDDLTAGTRRTGSVVFDVPDTPGALEYQDQFETDQFLEAVTR